jgi:hypothetical protein
MNEFYFDSVEYVDIRVPAPRAPAIRAVNSERDYQDAQRGNALRHSNQPKDMPPGEYLLAMEKCLSDAREVWYRGGTGWLDCLPHVRKVAALGVACMELYGAPMREDVQIDYPVGGTD